MRPTIDNNSEQRTAFRDGIVAQELAKVDAAAGRPVLFLMGGGSASGKSTLMDILLDTGDIVESESLFIDADELKKQIPEYAEIIAAGDSRAVAVVHEESSLLAKTIYALALDKKVNIVFDRTMAGEASSLALIQEARDAGYEIRLYGVTVDVETAITRAVERSKKRDNRYVPLSAIIETHKGFSVAFEAYVDAVDLVELWDTNTERSSPIMVKTGGQIEILDRIAYHKFLNKRKFVVGDVDV